ncbi:cyclase family protein [Pasteurella canis]|uniref:Cyclase n=1 Tax=Pasteurella canis TaxID=753 RepID=A0ABQ4VE66_9PAST|nr:cyclase family protein [Pasteurella canis]UAY77232.1 cyclase family protein [Pasteurella canis]UDW83272.1 cyclase family protein [Pasteurella canis]UEA16356.1 cyclase family protein [Pasteurella canis]UEC22797.1 cyclase family protein [Pasteurella canis]SPY38438.1 putative ucyclase [Pasteurella canis]
MNYQLLSYPLDVKDPGFPGEPTLTYDICTSTAQGDVYNSAIIHLFNHFGTHFDAPKHFNPNGLAITELPLTYFIYEKPLLIDLPKSAGSLIEPEDLAPYLMQIKQADCLLIRTGLEQLRAKDPQQYAANGGAVSIQAAKYLIDHASNLKAIGFDFISLASPANPDHGVEAHQVMLGMYKENFICIIEDMKLSQLDSKTLKRVLAMPLLVKGIDSAQVTVLAEGA